MKKTVPLLILAAVAAVGAAAHRELDWQLRRWRLPERPAESAGLNLPPCPGCNLILISADTLRADALDWNPAGATPNLARLAARSVRLTRAYANAFYTTPSHMTLFTSLYPNRHHVTGSEIHITGFERTGSGTPPLAAGYKTLAEILRENGYGTHWFGPLTLKHLDLELGFGRGFQNRSPTLFTRPGRFPDARGFSVPSYRAELERARGPFFHFLHSYITHLPYFAPGYGTAGPQTLFDRERLHRAYQKRVQQAPLPVPPTQDADRFDVFLHSLGQFQLRLMENLRERRGDAEAADDSVRRLRQGYALAVRELDRQIGELLALLEKSERTVLVLVSDHGEELFEHGHASHSTFYEHTARIPVLIAHPDVKEPRVYDGLVSLVDLLPTLLATLQIPIPPQAQGRDLSQGPAPLVFGFSLGSAFVTDGEWKLIRNSRGEDEFYNLQLDPAEQDDLAATWWPPVARAKRRMLEARERWMLEQKL